MGPLLRARPVQVPVEAYVAESDRAPARVHQRPALRAVLRRRHRPTGGLRACVGANSRACRSAAWRRSEATAAAASASRRAATAGNSSPSCTGSAPWLCCSCRSGCMRTTVPPTGRGGQLNRHPPPGKAESDALTCSCPGATPLVAGVTGRDAGRDAHGPESPRLGVRELSCGLPCQPTGWTAGRPQPRAGPGTPRTRITMCRRCARVSGRDRGRSPRDRAQGRCVRSVGHGVTPGAAGRTDPANSHPACRVYVAYGPGRGLRPP